MGQDLSNLKLECIAIGSVPHTNLSDAMSVVKSCFAKIPFWPQMVKVSKNEDMILQFLEGMPSFFYDKSYLDCDYDAFYEDLEQFFLNYETILSQEEEDTLLEKYSISSKYASSFDSFIKMLEVTRPCYAKGQIVGPFTLSTTLVNMDGKCAIYDETLKEIIVKTLTLKALWQIKRIKKANPEIVPIIFIDEPSISQLGTSAYVTVDENDVLLMIEEISNAIKSFGGLSAIHCCGKCDWQLPIRSGVNMINLDAYSFAQNLSIFSADIDKFLKNNGKIVWGIVPTLDSPALEEADLAVLYERFKMSVKYLTKKGVDEKLIIDNSLISTSCGAGSLTVELAEKAMRLTKELSEKLKEEYR